MFMLQSYVLHCIMYAKSDNIHCMPLLLHLIYICNARLDDPNSRIKQIEHQPKRTAIHHLPQRNTIEFHAPSSTALRRASAAKNVHEHLLN